MYYQCGEVKYISDPFLKPCFHTAKIAYFTDLPSGKSNLCLVGLTDLTDYDYEVVV